MTVGRLVVLIVLTTIAVGIALALQRRRPDPPSAPSYRAPQQLDRDDFAQPEAARLVVLFASTTCDTCPRAWAMIEQVMAGRDDAASVALERVDVETDPSRHARYRIDGVPTTVVADEQGVVVNAFFGPIDPEAFAASLG